MWRAMAALPTTATLSSGKSSDLTRCLRVITPLTNCSSLALSASSSALRRTSTLSLTAASSAAWALARPPSKRPGAVRATAPATASSRRDTFMGSSSSRSRLLQHCVRPRLHLRELPGDEPFVESGRHGRVPGARQHGRKLPGLELIDRPLEGVRHQRLVEIDSLVLVPGP